MLVIKKTNRRLGTPFLKKIGIFYDFYWQILLGLKRKAACSQPL